MIRILFFLVFVQFTSFAQDTLRLLNGKSVLVNYIAMDNDRLYFKKIDFKNGQIITKRKSFKNLENVFQLIKSDGTLMQIYEQDSTIDNFLSIEDMKVYLKGINYARTYYKAPKNFTAGYVFGLGSGYFGLMWGILPIAIYGTVANKLPVDLKEIEKGDNLLFKNEVFIAGFTDQAKIKQRNKAFIGGTLGLVTSLLTLQYLYNNGILQ
jgi:hypothetical protein